MIPKIRLYKYGHSWLVTQIVPDVYSFFAICNSWTDAVKEMNKFIRKQRKPIVLFSSKENCKNAITAG